MTNSFLPPPQTPSAPPYLKLSFYPAVPRNVCTLGILMNNFQHTQKNYEVHELMIFGWEQNMHMNAKSNFAKYLFVFFIRMPSWLNAY